MNNIVLENDLLILKDNDDKEINIKKDISTKIILINEKDTNNKLIFNLEDNSNLKINIFDVSKSIDRNITINLNGKNSYVELNISSISLKENIYEVHIFHNEKNTHSEANLHGLAIDDNKIIFKNNGTIKRK